MVFGGVSDVVVLAGAETGGDVSVGLLDDGNRLEDVRGGREG